MRRAAPRAQDPETLDPHRAAVLAARIGGPDRPAAADACARVIADAAYAGASAPNAFQIAWGDLEKYVVPRVPKNVLGM